MRTRTSLLATTSTILVLASCGGSDAAEETTMDQGAAAAAPATPATPGEVTTEIHPLTGYQSEGSARIVRDGDSLLVQVFAETHLQQGDYPTHIHEGRCAEGGRVVVQLIPIEGQEAGEGQSNNTIDASSLSPTGSYFIQIHTPTGTPVACGDLPPVNL